MDEDSIRRALARIVDPAGGQDLVSAGYVGAVTLTDGAAQVILEVPGARGAAMMPLAKAAETAIAALEGISSARVILTAAAEPGGAAPAQAAKGPPPDLRGGRGAQAGAQPGSQPGPQAERRPPQPGHPIPGVDRVLAVGSGKGGVGKSTVAANLAVALAGEGRRVGLLDADVYGPSQPRMMGVRDKPTSPDGQRINPLQAHGVAMISMGLLVAEETATVWRGPMLMKALQQFLFSVVWGELDVLIIDLPPGTGDVQLTLAQRTTVTGAVIVSTPQDVALLDARKAVDMFERTEVPLVGLIENMASFVCPKCGEVTPLFGHGGAQEMGARLGVPFLGEIPIDLDTRLSGDAGMPVVLAHPDSAPAKCFREIARSLIAAGQA
ncbi:MAG: Mrp/NBP35 family ATP-binding protein [Pseudomonadota bacterium]